MDISPQLQATLSRILLVIGIIIATWLARRITPYIARRIIRFVWRGIKAVSRTQTNLHEQLTTAIIPPIRLLITAMGLSVIFIIAEFSSSLRPISEQIIATLVAIGLFWGILRLVNVFAQYIEESDGIQVFDSTLIRFANQLGQTIIAVFAFVVIMGEWGYDLAGLVAGLGIGGLAFALAAQDTLANFFGYLAIITDAPFKVGHLVDIDGVEGFVEDISLRSTRLRQRDRSLSIIPNRTVADTKVTNWSRLNSRQIKMTVGVTYSSTEDRIVALVDDIRIMLDEHPRVTNKRKVVEFVEFGASSLDILIVCFVNTILWEDLQAMKMDINLKIMGLIQKHHLEIAFPTRTVVLESPTPEPVKEIVEEYEE